MKLNNVHLDDDVDAFVREEAKVRKIHKAEVIRELTRLGLSPYKRKHGKEKQ